MFDELGLSYRLKQGGRHLLVVCKVGPGEVAYPLSSNAPDPRIIKNIRRDLRRLKVRDLNHAKGAGAF
jgi:hypothetical protein